MWFNEVTAELKGAVSPISVFFVLFCFFWGGGAKEWVAENIIEWICIRQNNGSLFADGENRNGLELSCVFLIWKMSLKSDHSKSLEKSHNIFFSVFYKSNLML